MSSDTAPTTSALQAVMIHHTDMLATLKKGIENLGTQLASVLLASTGAQGEPKIVDTTEHCVLVASIAVCTGSVRESHAMVEDLLARLQV